MRHSHEHPARFNQFRTQLHDIFHVEQLSEQTQKHLGIDPNIEWTPQHEQLVGMFARTVYDSDSFEHYRYDEIYTKYVTTLETEAVPDELEDPHLTEFAETLLDNPRLADDFLTRYSNTFLIRPEDIHHTE